MTLGNDRLGKLLLRLALGVIMLMHGIAKLQNGIEPISAAFVAHGLPAEFAYAVYIGEVVAPLMLIFGFFARFGGLLIAITMLVAIYLMHASQVLALGPTGGWAIELQGLLLFAAIAVMLFGPGKPSVNDR